MLVIADFWPCDTCSNEMVKVSSFLCNYFYGFWRLMMTPYSHHPYPHHQRTRWALDKIDSWGWRPKVKEKENSVITCCSMEFFHEILTQKKLVDLMYSSSIFTLMLLFLVFLISEPDVLPSVFDFNLISLIHPILTYLENFCQVNFVYSGKIKFCFSQARRWR